MEEVKLRVRRRELGTVRPFCKINQKNGMKSARWFCRSRAGYKKAMTTTQTERTATQERKIMVKNAAAFGVYVRIISVSGKEDRHELFNNLSALLSLSGSNLGEDTANVDSHLIVVRQNDEESFSLHCSRIETSNDDTCRGGGYADLRC